METDSPDRHATAKGNGISHANAWVRQTFEAWPNSQQSWGIFMGALESNGNKSHVAQARRKATVVRMFPLRNHTNSGRSTPSHLVPSHLINLSSLAHITGRRSRLLLLILTLVQADTDSCYQAEINTWSNRHKILCGTSASSPIISKTTHKV